MLRLMKTGAAGARRHVGMHVDTPKTKALQDGRTKGPATPMLTALLLTAVSFLAAGHLAAQIREAAPVTYANHYEAYVGINFMDFQAGQDLPTRMNLGGGEVAGTYWLLPNSAGQGKLGITLDYRGDLGTTPVDANVKIMGRPLVRLNIGMAGVQWRGPKNHYAAINYHAYAGVGAGDFDHDTHVLGPNYTVGLYNNSVKPMAALGGSLDYNRTKNIAIRLQPDLILEHFGTETREFFSISGGVIYRFGKK
jgi:hypothetical protein